jgi:hypothetical protein
MDSGMGELKQDLIGKNAKGIVFEIGAGNNNTTHFPHCVMILFSLFTLGPGLEVGAFSNALSL